MNIRRATLNDAEGVAALGLEAMNNDGYDGLVISSQKVMQGAIDCISSESNFCWVYEEGGEILAAVSALVHDMMFYERKQATVIQFYCKKPGYGIGTRLIEEFLGWAESRRVIKMIVFTLECRADPKVGELLERLGLDKELPVYMRITA